MFRVYVMFCFFVFHCQYQFNQLPGKTHLQSDLFCVSNEQLNPEHLLTFAVQFHATSASQLGTFESLKKDLCFVIHSFQQQCYDHCSFQRVVCRVFCLVE